MQKIITILFITLSILVEPIYSQSGTYLKEAISAMEAGLFKEALKQLDIARVKEPNNAEVYKLKALLYEAINEYNVHLWSAREEYKKFQFFLNYLYPRIK